MAHHAAVEGGRNDAAAALRVSTLVEDLDPATFFHRRLLQTASSVACFSAADYLAQNPDLSAEDPSGHFVKYGAWERRSAARPERLTAKLSDAVRAIQMRWDDDFLQRGYRGALGLAPVIHLPSAANGQDALIAERLRAAFDAVGVEAFIRKGAPEQADKSALVVNPQAVFGDAREPADLQLYAASIVVASGDPQSVGFKGEAPYLLLAAGVIATHAETYALFAEAGVPAAWLGGVFLGEGEAAPDLDHPLIGGLRRAIRNSPAGLPWSDRPIDVLALQPSSPARANAWGRMADGLARFTTIVQQPRIETASDAADVRLRRYLYDRSKVVLHLHETAPSALSAAMIEEAATAGALIVSEPCPPHPLVQPGRDYLEISARRMPDLIETLIKTGDGRRTAETAIAALRRTLALKVDLEWTGLSLVNLMLDAADRRA